VALIRRRYAICRPNGSPKLFNAWTRWGAGRKAKRLAEWLGSPTRVVDVGARPARIWAYFSSDGQQESPEEYEVWRKRRDEAFGKPIAES
jgi:hypothetical protein